MPRALIISLLLGISPLISFCQNQVSLDSLIWSLENAKSDTAKVRLCLAISNRYTGYDYIKAVQFAKQAREIASESGEIKLEQKTEGWQGSVFFLMGDYKSASTHYFNAMKLYESTHDSIGVLTLYINLGAVYDRLEEYDKALTYYLNGQRMLSQVKMDDKKRSNYLPTLYNNIANIYSTKKNYTSARDYYEKALQIATKSSNKPLEALTLNNLGKLFLHGFKEPEKAYDYLSRGLQARRDIGNKTEIGKSLLNIFSYHLTQKQYDEARDAIDEVLKIGNETKSLELLRDGYHGIQMVEGRRDNYKEAFDASVNFKKLSDSIQHQFTGSELAKLQLQYDFEKAEQANVLEQNRIRTRYTIVVIVLSAGLLIAILIVVIVRYRARQIELKQKNLAQDVEMKNRELTTNVMYLIRKNELINDVAERLLEVKKSVVLDNQKVVHDIVLDLQREADNDSWKEFEIRFNQVHGDFYDKLRKLYPGLSPADEKLCAFLRLNMSSKEIAAITKQSVKSVEVARARLRKKLNLTNTTSNLVSHLSNL